MKKRILGLLAASMVSVFLVTACTGGNEEPADTGNEPNVEDPVDQPDPTPAPPVEPPSATGQTDMTIVTGSLAVSMDPIQSNDSASAQINKQLYSHLFLLDYDTFEPRSALAINWDQPDAYTTNIELRRGVLFHNGDPLTAHDVRFSLERGAVHPEVEPILGMISHVEVHDDYNFTVVTEMPFAPIIRHLAHTTAGIVPMNHLNAVGEDVFADNPVGSGPFAFSNLVIGDRVEMVRFENYWGNVPVIETLTWRHVPDPSTRLIEVQQGTADVALAIAPADLAGAEAHHNVNLMRRQGVNTNYIGFNVNRPHIDNPLVRQAINYALDTEAIVNTVFMGLGSPAHGPISSNVWGFSQQEPFPTSLDRARELLIEAGYNPTPGESGGFSTSIWWNIPNTQRQQIAEMTQFTLAQLNIDVQIESMEWPVYLDRTSNGEQDMFILGWVSVTGDADYGLFPLFHSTMRGPAGNRTFWDTPELDALLEAGRASVDEAERLSIYDEAQRIIRNEAPWVFLQQGELAHAAVANLRGLVLNPADHHSYASVWFE